MTDIYYLIHCIPGTEISCNFPCLMSKSEIFRGTREECLTIWLQYLKSFYKTSSISIDNIKSIYDVALDVFRIENTLIILTDPDIKQEWFMYNGPDYPKSLVTLIEKRSFKEPYPHHPWY